MGQPLPVGVAVTGKSNYLEVRINKFYSFGYRRYPSMD
jgi:hypothetical protein